MEDRELLELAAKAAGMPLGGWEPCPGGFFTYSHRGSDERKTWLPLTDDGDALRLAVRLRLDVTFVDNLVVVYWYDESTLMSGAFEEPINDAQDEREATRRAIVRAAAAIGKEM